MDDDTSVDVDSLGSPDLGKRVEANAAVQRHLQPAALIPLLRMPHSWREEWHIESTPDTFAKNITNALNEFSASPKANGFVYRVDRIQKTSVGVRIRVLIFTKIRWMDVANLTIRNTSTDAQDSSDCTVIYRSSGLFPLTFFAAPLINLIFAWTPFSHNELPKKKTLPEIREAVGMPITVNSRKYTW